MRFESVPAHFLEQKKAAQYRGLPCWWCWIKGKAQEGLSIVLTNQGRYQNPPEQCSVRFKITFSFSPGLNLWISLVSLTFSPLKWFPSRESLCLSCESPWTSPHQQSHQTCSNRDEYAAYKQSIAVSPSLLHVTPYPKISQDETSCLESWWFPFIIPEVFKQVPEDTQWGSNRGNSIAKIRIYDLGRPFLGLEAPRCLMFEYAHTAH